MRIRPFRAQQVQVDRLKPWFFVLLATAGCGGGGPTPPVARVPSSIVAVGPTNATGTVATPLSPGPSVRVSDAQGPMAGVSVTFSVTAGGGIATPPTRTTDANGLATVTWSLGSLAGPQALTASVGNLAPVTFSATAESGPPALVTSVAGNSQTATVGTPVLIPPAVVVTDAFGNSKAGITVTFLVQTGFGTLTGDTQVTDGTGRATVGTWTLGLIPGPQQLIAIVAGAGQATFLATATGVPPAAVLLIAGNNQNANAGTLVTNAPTVEARDSMGNPQPGVEVTFQVTSGGGSVLNGVQMTDALGRASVGGWILGLTPGVNTLETSIIGNLPVAFTGTGVAATAAAIAVAGGNGQAAVRGNFLPVAPSISVTDAVGNPVAGVTVTFTPDAQGGTVIGGGALTDFAGVARPAAWRLGPTVGAHALNATVAGVPSPRFASAIGQAAMVTASATPPPEKNFQVEIRFVGTPPTPAQQLAFDLAVAKWTDLIVGDLPDIPLATPASSSGCFPALNETVDDLLIFAELVAIDGLGGILGSAGPCLIRSTGSLSIVGRMRFDVADLGGLETNGTLNAVILHEMGHVLGFGTLWGAGETNLIRGSGGTDPVFVGPQAILGMLASQAPGVTLAAGPVPVENTGGPGTANGHWRESIFDNELMTGFNDLDNRLSIITTLSMRDMGYVVDDFPSDPYVIPTTPGGGAQASVGLDSTLRMISLPGPILAIDRSGRVTAVIPRE